MERQHIDDVEMNFPIQDDIINVATKRSSISVNVAIEKETCWSQQLNDVAIQTR